MRKATPHHKMKTGRVMRSDPASARGARPARTDLSCLTWNQLISKTTQVQHRDFPVRVTKTYVSGVEGEDLISPFCRSWEHGWCTCSKRGYFKAPSHVQKHTVDLSGHRDRLPVCAHWIAVRSTKESEHHCIQALTTYSEECNGDILYSCREGSSFFLWERSFHSSQSPFKDKRTFDQMTHVAHLK